MEAKNLFSSNNHQNASLKIVGWREWISLPDLGIKRIKAKIDTGARTSALHAFALEKFREKRKDKVRFYIHPLQRSSKKVSICVAEIIDRRWVTDSGGHGEYRFVIETKMLLGDIEQYIELTLTNRDSMTFRMLLGRGALKNSYLVNVYKSYLIGKKELYSE